MAGADNDWPSAYGAAWGAATDAAQRLARSASDIVASLHQTRIPDDTQTHRVKVTMAEMMNALAALNRLEETEESSHGEA